MHWRASTLAAVVLLVGCGAGGDERRGERRGEPLAFASCGAFRCATLDVPLDRRGGTGGGLKLRVAARGPSRTPRGVLIALTGGPGQGGVAFMSRTVQRLGDGLKGYRLVMLDQRGTGAGALRCAELQREVGTSDVTVAKPSAVRDCARRLGQRARFFTTTDTVADLDALRAALGAQKVSLLGVSYGTYVAERYALAHPDRVRRLVLDSVVPHTGVDLLYRVTAQAARRVLPQVCGGCLGDLRAVIARRPDLGPPLLDTLIALTVGGDLTTIGPALRAAVAGNDTQLENLIAAVHDAQRAPAGALSQALHAATICADGLAPWPHHSTPTERAAALARSRGAMTTATADPYGAATLAGQGLARTCVDWPAAPGPPRLAHDLPAVPTLLLSGEDDLSAPLEWARAEAARAPRGRLVVIPHSGHSEISHSAKARAAVRAFLQSP